MKQFKISFYKRRRDWIPSAIYYREFSSWKELQEWCKSMQNSCGYYRFFDEKISPETYLKNI